MKSRKSIDTDALLTTVTLSALIQRRVKLTKKGPEFEGLCPFHNEDTPSFTVNDAKGFYHCFGCGAHGDAIDWTRETQGVSFLEAVRILGGEAEERPGQALQQAPARAVVDPYAGIEPLPADDRAGEIQAGKATPKIFNPKRADDERQAWRSHKPSMVFPYRDAAGGLLGYVMRLDLGDGKKLTPAVRLARLPDGKVAWCLLSFDVPRPLYYLPELLSAPPGQQVWLVEGEKKADVLRGLGLAAHAWPGGTGGIAKVDWSPLKGRSVLYWPDQDESGEKAALGYTSQTGQAVPGVLELAQRAGATRLKFVPRDLEKPRKWDAWDAVKTDGWGKAEVLAWAKARVQIWTGPSGAPSAEPSSTGKAVVRPAEKEEPGGRLGTPSSDERRPAAPAPDERQSQQAPHLSPAPPEEPPPFDAPPDGGEPENGEAERTDYSGDGGSPRATDDGRLDEAPFRILGFNRGRYFFLPEGSQQIVELSATEMKQLNLLRLAPLWYWTRGQYQYDGKMSWYLAANDLMRVAEQKGVFHVDRVRGRGAWEDRGRSVFHAGEVVYVNGEGFSPSKVPSAYIYESEAPLHTKVVPAASNKEAHRLVEVCQRLTWDSKESGFLLAGWCVVAPVCGVLTWRPHIWITGPAGSGKTTALHMVVGQVVGPMALKFEGETTEAAIRQTVQRDARPIVFDEIESEDPRAATRVRSILNLARIASSGGYISKGGSNNTAMRYPVRSCFCFSSINTAVKAQADETRISKLQLRRNITNPEEHYTSLASDIAQWFTPDYAAAMFARSVEHAATLQANAQVFIRAAAAVLGGRRPADQIGTMLAGLYLCYSTKPVELKQAQDWIEQHYWDEHAAVDVSSDEMKMFEFLAAAKVRVRSAHGPAEYTIGELIVHAARQVNPDASAPDLYHDDADDELKRIGIKVLYGINHPTPTFLVANSSPALERILLGTPWQADWKGPLSRLPNTVKTEPEYFSPGLRSRAVQIPLDMLLS